MSTLKGAFSNATSWTELYSYVQKKTNERKMRLFGCSCCRRIWDLLVHPGSRAAVETGERYADGDCLRSEMVDVRKLARKAVGVNLPGRVAGTSHQWAASAAEMVSHLNSTTAFHTAAFRAAHALEVSGMGTKSEEHRHQSLSFHDIFENYFRPVGFHSSWRTDSAIGIATQMYDSRDFTSMPILADSLQDAGCENETILRHCREPGPHVRGCWVVDLVLDKQ